MTQNYVVKETDVLVVGGGLAGLWAAIRAKDMAPRVTLAEKGKVSRSGASVFCHSTRAPLPENQFDVWLKETVERSGYLADQKLAEIIILENNKRIRDMERWGVIFDRDEKGSLRAECVRGEKTVRSISFQGKQMMETMRNVALGKGVEFAERVMIIDLLTSDGQHPTKGHIVGAVGLHTRTGDVIIFKCGAVIISSGGTSAKVHCHYADNITGDGLAMAFRAGADMLNMEFAANPSFGNWERKFNTGGQQQFLMNGARIINRHGERFLTKYPAWARSEEPEFEGNVEFGDLCRAMAIELLEGRGPVYFDLRSWSQENIRKMRRVLPVTMAAFDAAGIDVSKQPIECTPMMVNYGMSTSAGIRVDVNFQSTVPGLFATGVCAMIGAGQKPQAVCNVTGYVSGEKSAALAGSNKMPSQEQVSKIAQRVLAPLQRGKGPLADEVYDRLNRIVMPYEISLFKEETRLRRALGTLRNIVAEQLPVVRARNPHELVKANEVRSYAQMLLLMLSGALERKESRFGHYREDYPYSDDINWLKWTVASSDENGEIKLETEPVVLPLYRPEEPSRIPARIQFTFGKGR